MLAVLECANRLSIITVKAISQECDIPASTVVRILETLCAEQYLVHVSRRGGYVLTSKVQALSAGFHGAPLIVEILKAYANELTRLYLWPFSVATLDRDAMVVQYSSIPFSPLAHVRSTLHKRLSLASRAHGLAYVAFCSSKERSHLVRSIASSARPEDWLVNNPRDWMRLLMQTRRRGYAVRVPDVDPSTRSIAVPILLEPGRVVATLGMTFFSRSVDDEKAVFYAMSLKTIAGTAAGRIRDAIAYAASRSAA
ncbi:MAG: IclR family transcriptional regulator domain-containing protein [Acetobacteraceae bacterium]